MATKKTVAKKAQQELVSVPDHIKQGGNRGNANVTNEDLQLPRINVLQDLSPQVKKSKPEFIEGAEVGMLFNTLTGELYPDGVTFTPVEFQKRWFVWKMQDFGGGLRGIFDFDKQADAEALTASCNASFKPEDYEFECVLTHEHLVMLADRTEVILSCAKSKLKVSKKFNSLVRLNGGDRFGRNYHLDTKEEQNDKSQDYFNFSITPQGGANAYPNKEQYEAAEKLWAAVNEGNTYGGDYSDEIELTEDEDDDAEVASY